jgi:hypothetical protein
MLFQTVRYQSLLDPPPSELPPPKSDELDESLELLELDPSDELLDS